MTQEYQYYHDGEFIEFNLPIDGDLVTYNPFDDLSILYYQLTSNEKRFKHIFEDASIDEVIRLKLSDEKIEKIKDIRRQQYTRFSDPLYIAWQHEVYMGTEESANEALKKWQNAVKQIKHKYPYSMGNFSESTYDMLTAEPYIMDSSLLDVSIND